MTIDGDGSETINGSTTITLTNDTEAVTLVCTGTLWYGLIWRPDLLTANNTFSGDNTFTGDVRYRRS